MTYLVWTTMYVERLKQELISNPFYLFIEVYQKCTNNNVLMGNLMAPSKMDKHRITQKMKL